MKRAFNYFFKKRLLVIGIISAIMLIITLITFRNMSLFYQRNYLGTITYYPDGNPFILFTIVAMILSTIFPMAEFSFKMKKTSVDLYYSLPIKKHKLYLCKYLIGLLEVIIPISISYIIGFLYVLTHENVYNMIYFLTYFVELIGLIVVLYTIISFIYIQNNTEVDGVINIIFFSVVFVFISSIVEEMFNLNSESILQYSFFFTYSPITVITTINLDLLYGEEVAQIYLNRSILSIVFFSIIAIALFVLEIFMLKKDKSEDCGQISNSYFSYKVMIPIILTCSLGLVNIYYESYFSILIIIIIAGAYFLYCLYQRKIKLKGRYFIMLGACVLAGIILSLIIQEKPQYIMEAFTKLLM